MNNLIIMKEAKKTRNKETWANELSLAMAHFETVEGLAISGLLEARKKAKNY